MTVIPAVGPKLYHAIVTKMTTLPFHDPERLRLGLLQRQLSEAQQAMLADKTLSVWQKAG